MAAENNKTLAQNMRKLDDGLDVLHVLIAEDHDGTLDDYSLIYKECLGLLRCAEAIKKLAGVGKK